MTDTTWFRFSIAEGVDGSKPGIYEVTIVGVGYYIGECANKRRPKCNYADNVERMIAGRPPRNGKAFREVHHALLDARQNGTPVSICMIETSRASGRNALRVRMN
jgi:hypothetical protein